jgi:hypothetical protein
VRAVLQANDYPYRIEGYANPILTEHFMNLVGNAENWAKFQKRMALGWSLDGQMDVTYEGGETIQQCWDRAKEFVETVRSGVYHADYIVAVSHGQFIKAAVNYVNGTAHHPKNGDLVILELEAPHGDVEE